MSTRPKPFDRGASAFFYNPLTLSIYDKGVLGLTNRYLWRCPTSVLEDNYAQNTGRNHLDIGPGTGYFLEHSTADTITLLDLNSTTLAAANARIAHGRTNASVDTITQSFFTPLSGQWDSIGVNFLLHCIDTADKWSRLAELAENLRPGGVLFGSTVIPEHHSMTPLAKALFTFYNRIGAFGNRSDTDEDLRTALSAFGHYTLERHGQALVFSATKH